MFSKQTVNTKVQDQNSPTGGLNPELKYQVDGLQEILSGAEWMTQDLSFPLLMHANVLREINTNQ